MTANRVDRRTMVKTTGVALAGAFLAGCSGSDDDGGDEQNGGTTDGGTTDGNDGGDGGATISAGPGGDFVFEPEAVTVGVGETVTWTFDSSGHNVSAYPDHADAVQLPDGAEPFGSIPADDEFATNAEGETYEYTFETAGTYQYVCVPHVSAGMVGTVIVEG